MNFFSTFARFIGVKAALLGFLMSIRNLLTGLFQGTAGRLSDKLGRKYILIFGSILSFLSVLPLIFFESTVLLVIIAIIQAFSVSIIVPTFNAVLGDVTEPSFRASFIGRITSIGRIVAVAFSLLLAAFFFVTEEVINGWVVLGWTVDISWRVQFSTAFALSSFTSLLCVLRLLFMKETKKFKKGQKVVVPKMRVALQDKKFMRFVIINAFFGITMALIWPINPIIQVDIFGMNFWQIAVMTSSFAVFTGLSQILGGKLADRMGRKPLIILSVFILVFFPVSMVPAILSGHWLVLLLSRFVGGLGTGINLVAVSAYALDLAPEELTGGYSGLKEVFYGFATFLGSFVSGFIIDALEKAFGIYTTTIAMSIGVTVLRIITACGYLFIVESLTNKELQPKLPTKLNET